MFIDHKNLPTKLLVSGAEFQLKQSHTLRRKPTIFDKKNTMVGNPEAVIYPDSVTESDGESDTSDCKKEVISPEEAKKLEEAALLGNLKHMTDSQRKAFILKNRIREVTLFSF